MWISMVTVTQCGWYGFKEIVTLVLMVSTTIYPRMCTLSKAFTFFVFQPVPPMKFPGRDRQLQTQWPLLTGENLPVVPCFFRRWDARNRKHWGDEDPPQHGAARAEKCSDYWFWIFVGEMKLENLRKMPWMVWELSVFTRHFEWCRLSWQRRRGRE